MVMLGDTPTVTPVISDRYPLHYGASGTVSVITSVVRNAELGYRLQYCDLLTELIEGDPHARGVLFTRAAAVSSRPWKIVAREQTTEADNASSAKLCDWLTNAIKSIPQWRQHVHGMLYAITYGVTGREIMWRRGPRNELLIKRLEPIPTRRIAYDWDWDLVWTVYGQANEGEKFKAKPGKFWSFEYSLSSEMKTREGLGRTLAYWLGFKRWYVRDFIGYSERYGKPVPDVEYNVGERPADEQDISIAKDLAKRYGAGSMAGTAHSSAVKVNLLGQGTNAGANSGENTPHKAGIVLTDEQVSKLVLGQAYTTNSGQKTGLGNGGQAFESVSQMFFESDAAQLAESIDTCILYWLTVLNFGIEAWEKYRPHYEIEIEDPEDEDLHAQRVERMVKLGYPMPVEDISSRYKWPLPEPGDECLSVNGTSVEYKTPAERAEEAAEIAEQEAKAAGAANGSANKDDDKPGKPAEKDDE